MAPKVRLLNPLCDAVSIWSERRRMWRRGGPANTPVWASNPVFQEISTAPPGCSKLLRPTPSNQARDLTRFPWYAWATVAAMGADRGNALTRIIAQ